MKAGHGGALRKTRCPTWRDIREDFGTGIGKTGKPSRTRDVHVSPRHLSFPRDSSAGFPKIGNDPALIVETKGIPKIVAAQNNPAVNSGLNAFQGLATGPPLTPGKGEDDVAMCAKTGIPARAALCKTHPQIGPTPPLEDRKRSPRLSARAEIGLAGVPFGDI